MSINETLISPIYYMGSKRKAINNGLIDYFPKNIGTFLDMFAGSAIVSMNTKAQRHMINDTDVNLYSLYNIFKDYDPEYIINRIEQRIEQFGLARERTKRNEFKDKEKIEQYKQAYMKFRDLYNKTKDDLDMYVLMFYSFSQQFRFNNKGDFNMPVGNDCFTERNKQYILDGCNFFGKTSTTLSNKDFREFPIHSLTSKDFVYLDPPYLNTTAVYNENNGWTTSDETDLFILCETLNRQGVRWALSNAFENKGVKNEMLINWCKVFKWNTYNLNRAVHSACGKGNSNTREVLITNY